MSVTDRNERRIKRMNTWISHAKAISGEEEAHIRFLFYWIAYEAAYQRHQAGDSGVKDYQKRQDLHGKLARHDRRRLQRILRAQKGDIVDILELRQAHLSFWREKAEANAGVKTAEEWEVCFRDQVRFAKKELGKAVRSGDEGAISKTVGNLFRNLSVVRNQIVHGASAGSESRGRTQVILGARLLSAFVPCFRDGIEANLHEDWGELPFPHVGSEPDEKCSPPWLLALTAGTDPARAATAQIDSLFRPVVRRAVSGKSS